MSRGDWMTEWQHVDYSGLESAQPGDLVGIWQEGPDVRRAVGTHCLKRQADPPVRQHHRAREGAHHTLDSLARLLSKGVKALTMEGARSLPGVACLLCRDVARVGVDVCVIKLSPTANSPISASHSAAAAGGTGRGFIAPAIAGARLAKPVAARRSLRLINGPIPCIAVLGVRVCWTVHSLRHVAYRRLGLVQERLFSDATPDLSAP
jgi:hypothetical protein